MSVSFTTFYSSGLNYPSGLLFDSVGNLYISNQRANPETIVRVTPAGVGSVFSQVNQSIGLKIDSSGNIVSASNTGNYIRKITPAGVATTFYNIVSPNDIAFDSLGNLFVTQVGITPLTRITPAGVGSQFFSVVTNGSVGLILDSNDNVFFTEGNTIAKVTKTGTLSTFIPTGSLSSPYGLTIDSDNNIYCANSGGNNIIKITPAGNLSTIGSVTSPRYLTLSPDGFLYVSTGSNTVVKSSSFVGFPLIITSAPSQYPCFKKGSKILTDKGYKPIQDLRKGDLVKTFKSGYKPISLVGKKEIHHKANSERIKDQLYKLSKHRYPALWEDLILTGCHSILVDDFVSERQKEKTIQINGDAYLTEDKYRLPTCADEKATVYETPGKYTVYHVALENDSYYGNYGIYANGLLVESCSKRYLKELSNMNFVV
jgi:streptogramin lyase